jgi:hypothetical protein
VTRGPVAERPLLLPGEAGARWRREVAEEAVRPLPGVAGAEHWPQAVAGARWLRVAAAVVHWPLTGAEAARLLPGAAVRPPMLWGFHRTGRTLPRPPILFHNLRKKP